MLQKNKCHVNLDVFNVHHLLTKIIAQDNDECKQKQRQNDAQSNYFLCADKLKAKSCSRTPVGAKLQPAIFYYFRALHSQMRYSSQAQKTPLKSSSTSFTLLARPGEKAWIYSSITATKSAKKRI